MFETIKLSTDERGVAQLVLARADKHNAMSEQMLDDLLATAQQIATDRAIRVVVLSSEGKSFCAGGDLAWMRAQMDMDPKTRSAQAAKLAYMLQALDTLPQPLIGRIHANAFGGGVGLASVCDIAIGVEGALMGLTETRLGLIPATIGPYVVARMGAANARRVFMSGRRFETHEAQNLGLLAKVVPLDALDAAIEAEVTPYLSCAPGAVADAKALVRALSNPIDERTIEHTIDALAQRWESPESLEGISAFFEKRAPDWAGQP
ncbi:crotonase/enoyl-CoA hydratase family protein [Planktotalea sp.]|uniref:crotonase/enoyl-CoA hydratase family protein n=1 Tax=Planktotalea sp. TaxID=2029877 RepID=UPI0035C7ABE0